MPNVCLHIIHCLQCYKNLCYNLHINSYRLKKNIFVWFFFGRYKCINPVGFRYILNFFFNFSTTFWSGYQNCYFFKYYFRSIKLHKNNWWFSKYTYIPTIHHRGARNVGIKLPIIFIKLKPIYMIYIMIHKGDWTESYCKNY